MGEFSLQSAAVAALRVVFIGIDASCSFQDGEAWEYNTRGLREAAEPNLPKSWSLLNGASRFQLIEPVYLHESRKVQEIPAGPNKSSVHSCVANSG
ncbi:hypothetical protein Mapa_002990 [Marchantia paleacea]|nr:hypothetical protein Mapa_002990 [Marchantia paleacea]